MPYLTLAPPIEVLLVDDQRAILAGVSALIGSEGEAMRVSGCATTGRQAIDLARSLRPDVIVLDVDLGGEDGLELIPQLRACCDAAIIVFSGLLTTDTRFRALYLGAFDCVAKNGSGDPLLAAIHAAAAPAPA
ncbi:Transcriptional regulatory protein LiaR [Azoarcus sp. Aa7]|nr:Transcriptional regulatory protein LiaR [Azoarcus sp. Aa7]